MCLSFEAIIVSAQFPSAFFLMHCQRTASLTAAFSGNLHHFNGVRGVFAVMRNPRKTNFVLFSSRDSKRDT